MYNFVNASKYIKKYSKPKFELIADKVTDNFKRYTGFMP